MSGPRGGGVTHSHTVLEEAVRAALLEDLGAAGDVTAAATIPADKVATGRFVPRQGGVVAGLAAARAVCAAVDPAVAFGALRRDGDAVSAGETVATVTGPARSLLAAERTALNFLTHLSGVATLTSRYVAAVAGTGAMVRDTRKTLPGLRALEKAAVAAGGGTNHRAGLFDALLVKDNHIVAAGGVGAATRLALERSEGLPVQIEVDSLDELEEALTAGAPAVLLDNFGMDDLRAAVARCRRASRPVFVEASGGVTLQTVAEVAATGVDAVAVGAITHSAPALDIGVDLVREGGPGAARG